MKNTLIKAAAVLISFLVLILSFNSANAYPRHAMNRIHPGMHPAQVRSILGNPQKIVYLANRTEQWFYPKNQYRGTPQGTKVLEFKRGQVVALFDQKTHRPNRHHNMHHKQPRTRIAGYHRRPQVIHCHSYYPSYPRYPAPRVIRYYPRPCITPGVSISFGATI